mgnify:FL=1
MRLLSRICLNRADTVIVPAEKSYVTFAGEEPWSQSQNYYALGDVFVSASRSATQGFTYAEALVAGKPLLVRKDDCLNGLLLDGVNGYAYEDERGFLEGYEKNAETHPMAG